MMQAPILFLKISKFSWFIFLSPILIQIEKKSDSKLKENGGGFGGVAVGEMLSPPRVPK